MSVFALVLELDLFLLCAVLLFVDLLCAVFPLVDVVAVLLFFCPLAADFFFALAVVVVAVAAFLEVELFA